MRPVLRKNDDTQEAKTRVQLDLAPSQMERLNWLMEVCEIETRKELMNTALSIFEWAVKEVMDGKTIASVDKQAKHFTDLVMPALADAARRSAARSKHVAAEYAAAE